jgi:hypothetical protein
MKENSVVDEPKKEANLPSKIQDKVTAETTKEPKETPADKAIVPPSK